MPRDVDPFLTDADTHEIEALAAAVASLQNDLGPDTKISLFGSRARRDHRPDSDYDILCLVPDDLPRDIDWMAVMARAEKAMEAAVPGAAANTQIIAESVLEDAYFEWPFVAGALRDGIDLIEALGEKSPTPAL